jgi:predicted aspartyl protease
MRELAFECGIAPAFDPTKTPIGSHPKHQKFRAIFDTGATDSVITQKVAIALGLKPIGMTMAYTANGPCKCEVFLVNLHLPNNVGFTQWRVTKQDLPPNTDILIGMDVIGCGDFAVTHKDNKTVFSFRCPSVAKIDFVQENKAAASPVKTSGTASNIGRNWRCPCGSGEKYKNCCGKGKH